MPAELVEKNPDAHDRTGLVAGKGARDPAGRFDLPDRGAGRHGGDRRMGARIGQSPGDDRADRRHGGGVPPQQIGWRRRVAGGQKIRQPERPRRCTDRGLDLRMQVQVRSRRPARIADLPQIRPEFDSHTGQNHHRTLAQMREHGPAAGVEPHDDMVAPHLGEIGYAQRIVGNVVPHRLDDAGGRRIDRRFPDRRSGDTGGGGHRALEIERMPPAADMAELTVETLRDLNRSCHRHREQQFAVAEPFGRVGCVPAGKFRRKTRCEILPRRLAVGAQQQRANAKPDRECGRHRQEGEGRSRKQRLKIRGEKGCRDAGRNRNEDRAAVRQE